MSAPAGRFAWRPPVALLLFAFYPLASLLNPDQPLDDPGIGWHLLQGRQILEGGGIPLADVFSFTASGAEWVSFYWLFEWLAAVLERLAGLPLFTAAAVLLYATVPVLIYRRMLRMGVGTLPALLFALLAFHVVKGHALVRPHIVTYVFFALLLDGLERVQDGSASARSLWWTPPLALLWANLHGGFTAGLALCGLFAGVAGARWLATHESLEKQRLQAFAGLLGAMTLATCLNPSGPFLHLSILDYLGMESTRLFTEWMSPNFSGSSETLLLEALIVGLALLLAAGARIAWIEALLVGFFLHQALVSQRHVTLFVIVTVPIVAREAVRAAGHARPQLERLLARVAAPPAPRGVALAWYGAFCAGFLGLAAAGALPYRTNLDDLELSAAAAAHIEAHPQDFARPFNTDNLGGALIYRFWPELRVFMDDRTPVYGDRFILDDYLIVARARPGWQAVLERWSVDSAVVKADTSVDALLSASPDWRAVHRDELNALFVRAAR